MSAAAPAPPDDESPPLDVYAADEAAIAAGVNGVEPRTVSMVQKTEGAASLAAEEAVIGSLFLGAAWGDVAGIVHADDFSSTRLRLIFTSMSVLACDEKPIDLITVPEQLRSTGHLQALGDISLSKIANDTPTAKNAVAYAKVVRAHADGRRVQRLARVKDGAELLDGVQRVLTARAALVVPEPRKAKPIDWPALQTIEPPAREWVVPHWIPAAHVTLLAGRAGIGKTLLAQHLGAALANGANYIEPLTERRVLMWAGEDDVTELWRRQIHISSYLGHQLSALTDRFFLHSYAGADITLAAPVFGRLEPTALLGELRQQVHDYKADLVILDNVARIFGGSENDRHAVTTFIAWLQGACAPAALLLLGHPAKAAGSEFSGSTAWEGAVRARLYLSDRPPDTPADDDAPIEERFRFLSRRKANYSALEIRRFSMADGVLIPELPDPGRAGRPSGEFVKDVVRRAVQRLAQRDIHGSSGKNSPNYLPKLAKQFSLLDTVTEKSFTAAMRELIMAGELTSKPVGQYGNRTSKLGLVLTQ